MVLISKLSCFKWDDTILIDILNLMYLTNLLWSLLHASNYVQWFSIHIFNLSRYNLLLNLYQESEIDQRSKHAQRLLIQESILMIWNLNCMQIFICPFLQIKKLEISAGLK